MQNNFPHLCTFYNLQSIVHTRPLFWHQMSIWNLDVRQPTFMFDFIFGNQFSWFFIGRIWCIGHINLGLYYVAVSIAFSFHNYKAASKIYSLWKDLKTIDTARCTSMCRARWQMLGNGRIYLKKINKLMISHSKNQYWGFYIKIHVEKQEKYYVTAVQNRPLTFLSQLSMVATPSTSPKDEKLKCPNRLRNSGVNWV